MPRISVNLTDAESMKPVPDDTYEAVVEAIDGPHQGAKVVYFRAKLRINSGPYEGRRGFGVTLPIEGKGAAITARFVDACLGTTTDIDNLEEMEFDTDELEGCVVGMRTRQEEYPEGSGEMRSNVQAVLPAT